MAFKLEHIHLKTREPHQTARFYIDNLGATDPSDFKELRAVAQQGTSGIVAAGYTTIKGVRQFLLVRIKADGSSLDPTFGEGGHVAGVGAHHADNALGLRATLAGYIFVCCSSRCRPTAKR